MMTMSIAKFDSLRPSDAYASVNQVTIGPDNGLWPVRHQTIIWTYAD